MEETIIRENKFIDVDNSKEGGDGFISLKEAGKLSGYSSDYIGQLIRQGKLSGKQVYCNVAWVTTKEAVGEYLNGINCKNGNNAKDRKDIFEWRGWLFKLVPRVLPKILYLVIGILLFTSAFLFYVLAANIEHRAEERAVLSAELRK